MRILKYIRYKLLSWSYTIFWQLIYKKMCSSKRGELTIRSLEWKGEINIYILFTTILKICALSLSRVRELELAEKYSRLEKKLRELTEKDGERLLKFVTRCCYCNFYCHDQCYGLLLINLIVVDVLYNKSKDCHFWYLNCYFCKWLI